MNDFNTLIKSVQTTVNIAEDTLDADIAVELTRLLARAKATIEKYRYTLDNVFHIDGPSKIKRRARMREVLGENERKVGILRQELASIRSSLVALLAITNTCVS